MNLDIVQLDTISNKTIVYINIFGVSVKCEIVGESYDRDTTTIEWNQLKNKHIEFNKQTTSQIKLVVIVANVLYSTFVGDLATTVYFLTHHETNVFSKKHNN